MNPFQLHTWGHTNVPARWPPAFTYMQAKLVLLYDVPLCIYGTVGVLHVTLFVLLPGMEKKGIPKSSLPFPFFQESFCVKLGRLPEASKSI